MAGQVSVSAMRVALVLSILAAQAALAAQDRPGIGKAHFLGAEGRTLTFADLALATAGLNRLFLPVPAGERCIQFSSYDRASNKGPGDLAAWYANADFDHFLRIERRAGHDEPVLVDVAGPGSVVRIWSPNPRGRLFFYVDGATEPTWEVGFEELCAGKHPLVKPPLAGETSRGWNCHVPFPFQKQIKITASERGFYYQVNVRLFAPDREVESFAPRLLVDQADALSVAAMRLAAAPVLPPLKTVDLAPGARARIVTLESGGLVDAFACRLLEGDARASRAAMRDVLVVAEVDGHETVRVPYADFFAAAPDLAPHGGLPIFVSADGTCVCRFPQPARKQLVLELVNEGERKLSAAVGGTTVLGALPEGVLMFHASWHQAKALPTRPFSDHRVLAATGAGRFVGCALMVRNPSKAWWGEGDEKFFVDGEAFPSTFGTGTEDYFGYGWCWPELFSHPLHSQSQCDGPKNFGFTSVSRWQIAEAVPFAKSFRFDLEVWHWDVKVKVDYASTAYWYAEAKATSGLPGVPTRAEREIADLVAPALHRVPGAIEAEKLATKRITGGRRENQDLSSFLEGKWSGDEQLWWIDAKPGDELELTIPVARAGRYTVCAAFTKAKDYGVVALRLAGKDLADPIDLYSEQVVASGEIALGEIDLAAGDQSLILRVVGKNKKAIARHMVGVDYLRLALKP